MCFYLLRIFIICDYSLNVDGYLNVRLYHGLYKAKNIPYTQKSF